MTYSIIVHGGAYNVPDSLVQKNLEGCRAAVKAGASVLEKGGSAVEAVEAAIRVLESDGSFDAGVGSVLNEHGQVEVDAMIMDGSTLNAGAVASVKDVFHPITLAKEVMKQTPHVLVVGQGAQDFAKKVGVEVVPQEQWISQIAKDEWFLYKKNYTGAVKDLFNNPKPLTTGKFPDKPSDTVGAVAIDKQGRIAAGTSTGGITGKMSGRVGDSPLIGSGGYANEWAGISTTGHGESIAKVTLARHAVFTIEQSTGQLHPSEACHSSLQMMRTKVGGSGGLICIDRLGRVGFDFSTPRMPHAYIEQGKEIVSGIEKSHRHPMVVNKVFSKL